jgi:hypothetical protein
MMAKQQTKVFIKFLGNYQTYNFDETYEMTEEQANPFLVLGYARVTEKPIETITEKESE